MAKKKYHKWLLIGLLIAVLLSILSFFMMPNASKLKKGNPGKTALMQYREKAAREKRRPFRISQIWVPSSKISPYLIKAVLIAEDDKFWKHEGFDYEAIQKALEKDLKAGNYKYGGSTITQQLARNLYLSPEKSIIRKIFEAILTWRIEKTLPKKRILELYLNVAEWGEGIFGAEAASRRYFGKPAAALTPLEAARLASVLPNPRKYNPVSDQRYVVNRANLIYNTMTRRGIVPSEFEEPTQSAEPFAPFRSPNYSY